MRSATGSAGLKDQPQSIIAERREPPGRWDSAAPGQVVNQTQKR